jgi:NAD(P)-dependent dehydrogenase (short-subunit alcohol dehydrogenase family)
MGGTFDGRVDTINGAGKPDGIGFATAEVFGREGARLAIAAVGDAMSFLDAADAIDDHAAQDLA